MIKYYLFRLVSCFDKKFLLPFLLPYGTKRREVIKKYLYFQLKNFFKHPKNKKPNSSSTKTSKDSSPSYASFFNNEDKVKISRFHDKFYGKRCFIIGNGPSLNKHDLSKLKNEFSFGVNGIFYKTDEMGFKPTFYVVEDGHVVDDNLKRINDYDVNYKFFPSIYKNKIKDKDNVNFFRIDLGFYQGSHPFFCKPRFTNNFSNVAYAGQSVTHLNLQLAYYMGFTEVYLIGMDFNYVIRETDKTAGASITTNDADVNHFHPEYFGYGKKWHDPKVDRVALNYKLAKKEFENDGRKIYNATIGGKLEIFERVDYDSLF